MGKTIGGLVAVLLVLSACTGGSDDKAGRSEVPTQMDFDRDATVVEPAWTLDVEPIGQPVVSGRVAVLIAKESRRRLKIVGVDTRDGKQMWSHPFSPNQMLPGYPLTPHLSETEDGDERVVFYLAPDEPITTDPTDVRTPIAAVDPDTGTIEARSRPLASSQAAVSCDDGTDVCVPGNLDGGFEETNLRFDLDDETLEEVGEGAPANARLIGEAGLFSTDDRPAEKLGVQRGDRVLWSKRVSEMFGDGYSSDGGWAFLYESEPDRYTGYVGEAPDGGGLEQVSDDEQVRDLARSAMVSFSGEDGEVLWDRQGVETCFEPPYASDEETVGILENPFLCTMSGKVTYTEDDEPKADSLKMSVEGYEARSGKTTWSHRLTTRAAKSQILGFSTGVVDRTRGTIVAELEAGLAIVDVASGKVAPATGQTFMCQSEPTEFEYVMPFGQSGSFSRYGTGLVYACSADGETVDSGMTVASLNEGAVRVTGSSYVLATEDGLVGYRTTDR